MQRRVASHNSRHNCLRHSKPKEPVFGANLLAKPSNPPAHQTALPVGADGCAFGVWWVVAALNVPNVPAEAAEAAEVCFQIDFGAARCENGSLPTIPCQCAEQDEDESEEG